MTTSPSSLMSPEGRNFIAQYSMKNILDIIKLVLVLALVGYFADSGLTIYKTNIRNTAIDGCANSSKYQASYKENNRDIVISQTQTLLYESCLKDKGISTNPNR